MMGIQRRILIIKKIIDIIFRTDHMMNVLDSKIDDLNCILKSLENLVEKDGKTINSRLNKIENYIETKTDNDVLDKILDEVAFSDEQPNVYINKALFKLASYETAQFVIENMNDAVVLNYTQDVLELGIKSIQIDGLYLEFGVYSGTTINKIASLVGDNQKIYGFDSFEGLPETWRSGFEKGAFKRNDMPIVAENVELVKGWFEDTIPNFIKKHPQNVAFIHVDCDLYSSTKTIFELLEPNIVTGTVIVFDEFFNYPGWKNHEYKAFMEYIEKTGHKYRYLGYVNIKEQVAIIIEG